MCLGGRRVSKRFFFEKKKQKTFAIIDPGCLRRRGAAALEMECFAALAMTRRFMGLAGDTASGP
jgi:hypothetical protein